MAKLCDKPADNMVTICVNNNDIMNSVSDDRDSDIANMSDFSDDEDGIQEESQPGTQIGGVQDSSFEETLYWCDRPTDNMMMTSGTKHDMVYSESDDRNSDITDMSGFSDSDDQTQEEIRPGPQTGSDRCDSIGIVSEVYDQPVTNTVTAEDDRDSLDPNDREYSTKFRLLTRRAFLLDDDSLSDSNFPEAVKDVVRRSRLTMMALDEYEDPPFEQQTDDGTPVCSDEGDNMDSDDSDDEYGYTDYWPILHAELPGAKASTSNDVDVNDSPVIQDYVCPERTRQNDVSVYIDTQLLVKNFQRKMTICCFGLCGLTDRFIEPELRWCWDCVDRLVWGYRVSCLMAIVNANRSLLIDVFTEDSRMYASGLGLVGDPVRPYDVIRVYLRIKENFQGGVNNVMLRNKDPVDSRYHQRCMYNKHEMGTYASVNRQISVKGQFGCLYSPIHDADWLDGYPNRVGGSVIAGTNATVTQFCSYMGEIPTEVTK